MSTLRSKLAAANLKVHIHSKSSMRVKRVNPFLAPASLCEELKRIGTMESVRAGTALFRKGEETRGVFLVLKGRFALSAGEDPTRITRISERGSLLGLPATIRNKPYSLTAEAVTDANVCFIPALQFRSLLIERPSVGMVVVEMLAEEVAALRELAVYGP